MPAELTMNQREHFNIRDYKCEYCSATFKEEWELTKHSIFQHWDIKTKCSSCDFESNVINVENHLNRKHKITTHRHYWILQMQKLSRRKIIYKRKRKRK